MVRSNSPNMAFLEESIITPFREVIDSSVIFTEHESYKHLFNMICVFMDRIDSAVRYLNVHAEMPKTEEEFVVFLVYATILRDGVIKLYENIFHTKPPFITEWE